jgi:murein L,D-transpeptidase YcbB/YkuD
MSCSWRWLVGASLIALTGCADLGDQSRTVAHLSSASAPIVISRQKLSPQGETALRAIIDQARLEALRSPDFTDYLPAVKKFYELNGYALGWVNLRGASDQATSLIASLQNAEDKGLLPEDYDGPRWGTRLANLQQSMPASEMDRLTFDVALTVSAMRYSSDLHLGRVNPRYFNFGFDIEQKRCDLAEFLHRVAEAQDVNSVLQEIEPPFEAYRRTERALGTYSRLAREHNGEPLAPIQHAVKPGDVYPDVPRLARLLRELGDLPEHATIPDPRIYQGSLVDAVKQFQRRHGLSDDGWITQHTISELNVPLSQRVQQLQLALERWRWIPEQSSQPPIVVNIPEFKLRAIDEQHKPALIMNVVVGKAYQHRTPVFAKAMKYVIFRPYWDVPQSITRAEFLPLLKRDRHYLSEHDYEIVDANEKILNEGEVSDDALLQLRTGRARIRQKPGPNNSLGLVKFVFPNEEDVYLHSTPSRELFSKPRRDFSHGCIRVEHAEALAVWVLRAKPGWTIDRIRAVMNGAQTVRVNLDKPIPVLIVYATAIVLASGEVHFYDDIYGYDTALEQTLAKGYPYPK